MAAQIFGSAATVLEMNIALFGLVPSNNAFNNQLGVVGTNNANLVAYVNQITNANYGGVPDSTLATAVLNNVLGTDPSNNATLNAALTALLAANPANRGVVIYNVVNLLTGLENNATYGAAAKIFNQEVTNGNVYSSDPTSNVSAPPNPNLPVVVGKSFTLTSGVDVLPGTAADDVFFGTEATLSSLDTLTGGGGNDTLKFASSGAVAVNKAGFTTSGIQTAQVTSDATGGTNFDVTGMTGVTTLINDNSSTDVTFNGAANIMSATLQNVSSGNTQFIYQAAAVAGTSDAMSITLSNDKQINGTSIGTVTANGIETFNVTTSKGASVIQELGSAGSLKAINISGDSALTLGAANFSNTAAANTVDASKLTAALNLTLSNDDAANIAVAVTGGSANDRVSFKAFDKGDSFTGGAGTDTIALTNTVATGAPAGTLSGVETLEDTGDLVGGVFAGAAGTINMNNFAGVTNVYLSSGLGGAVGVSNATTGLTETVNVGTRAVNDLSTTLKTDGAADSITLQLNQVNKSSTVGNINVGGFETVNLNTVVDASLNGAGALSIASLNDTAATTLNINSGVNLTVTGANTGALTKVDASASTGNLTLNSLTYAATGATIIGGKGADTFTPGNGADTITLGTGADVLTYTTAAQSNDKMDIITDFKSGEDKLNLAGLGVIASSQYLGSRSSFGLAQGALSAGGAVSAVLDSSTNILWVDTNGDGTLDNRDFRIQLNGVTSLTSTDLSLSSSGLGVTINTTNSNVSKTLATNASGSTTDLGDTITTKQAYVATATIDGALGTDNLTLSDATAGLAVPATITGVEVLNLATVSNTANTVTSFANNAVTGVNQFNSINGSSNSDTITSTANMDEGGTIALGAGADTITALTLLNIVATNASTSTKVTVDMGDGDDQLTTTTLVTWGASTVIGGGAGTDTLVLADNSDISAGTVSGFENVTAGATTTTMTAAQYNTFTGTVTNAGTITLTTAGTINNAVGNMTLANGTNTVNSASAGTQTITGGTGADTLKVTAGFTFGTDIFTDANAGDGDTFNLAYDAAANITLTASLVGIENVIVSATQTAATASITLNATTKTLDTTAATNGFTFADTAGMTSIKLGSGNDTISTVVANTAAETISFGAGTDTITSLNVGNFGLTLNFGAGNDTISDIATHGTGVLTLQFGTPAAGTQSLNIAATTANLASGDILDFATAVTSVVSGAANGTLGVAGAAGQVFVDTTTSAGNTIITFDADGSRAFSAGDIQITVVGQVLAGGISIDGNANFQVA